MTGLAAGSVAVAADAAERRERGFGAEAVLPYLAVPLLAAALRRRPTEGAALLGVAAVALVVGGALARRGRADHPARLPGRRRAVAGARRDHHVRGRTPCGS